MNTKAHVFLGTTTAVAFSHFVLGFDIRQDFLVGAGVALGSILPDVDHPGAWLSNHFPTTATLLCKFFGLSGKHFGDDHYQQTLKIHRGICHSFAACIQIIQLFIVFLFFSDGRLTLFSLCWGMLFHILVDCFSPMGCMLFAVCTFLQSALFLFHKTHSTSERICLLKKYLLVHPTVYMQSFRQLWGFIKYTSCPCSHSGNY